MIRCYLRGITHIGNFRLRHLGSTSTPNKGRMGRFYIDTDCVHDRFCFVLFFIDLEAQTIDLLKQPQKEAFSSLK